VIFVDLLQLRYFYDSANYKSISKTAEKYRVPPSSVSASIRRLEKELGVQLFDRSANRILPNRKGAVMQESLGRIFAELDRMLEEVSGAADDTKEIRILVKAGRSWITERVIRYKSRHANTRFELVADFDETDLNRFDIIIDEESDRYTGYETELVFKRKILLYAAADRDLCGRRLRMKDLAKEPFAVMNRQGNQGKILHAACKRSGFTPNIVAEVNDSACFRKIIASGIAIGLGTERAVHDALTPLNVVDFSYEQPVCIYYRPESNYGNTARFISFLLEQADRKN
jgi:DNA-binding transcriptional LysR family regulator